MATSEEPRRVQPDSLRTLREVSTAALAILLVAAVVWLLGWITHRLLVVIVPVAVALLATAVLEPLQERLRRLGVNRTLATFLVLLAAVALIVGLAALIVPRVSAQTTQLRSALTGALADVEAWLRSGPLNLAAGQVERLRQGVVQALSPGTGGGGTTGGGSGIAAAAMTGARIALTLLAGIAFTLFLTFFFVRDGENLAEWIVAHTPKRWRAPLREGGAAGWDVLARYLRGLVILAAFNAVVTAIVLAILGVPLVFSLATLEFFLSFIPLIGALTAGALAALVTLATNGLTDALIVVAMAIVIEQIEGNVLEPLVIGRAVDLHPVVVATLVAIGGIFFGIVGAFLAVPIGAVLTSAVPAGLQARDEELLTVAPPARTTRSG